MSEMVERVILAMAGADDSGAIGAFGSSPDYEAMARAGIAAMRAPTEAMISAAANTEKLKMVDSAMALAQVHGVKYPAWEWGDSPIADGYRAMVDQALA